MTWSARMRTDRGMVRPRALAVFGVVTSSKRVGCSTGRVADLRAAGAWLRCVEDRICFFSF